VPLSRLFQITLQNDTFWEKRLPASGDPRGQNAILLIGAFKGTLKVSYDRLYRLCGALAGYSYNLGFGGLTGGLRVNDIDLLNSIQ
jgi:hypothetical protein